MKTDEIAELERALKMHQTLLEDYLNRDDINQSPHYMPIAGQLRVLLCDADIPILLRYAKTKGVNLKVWAPVPLPDKNLREGLVFMVNFNVASWTPFFRSRQTLIEKFLDAEIGYALSLNNDNAKPYTPRQVIKWVANKEGIAHLDFKKPATLMGLKAWQLITAKGDTIDDALIRQIILQIGKWAYSAVGEVLDPVAAISIIVRLRLKRLPMKKTPFFNFCHDHSAIGISCAALHSGIEVGITQNGCSLGEINVKFPEDWKENADAVFCIEYSSMTKQVSVSLNGEMKASAAYDLGIIRGNELTAEPISGIEDNFACNVTLIGRNVSPNEIHKILSLPFDWVDTLRDEEKKESNELH